ncbi:hypothetical protein OF83DRAFT_1168453 [Amylostereum chailletii]|nr:hypothetical protein OF83DRAFT_1168453 [Amylostereum chailletii]
MRLTSPFKNLSVAVAVTAIVPTLVAASANVVYSPKILSPSANTVWTVGSVETVIWDASDAPKDISNAASVVLKQGTSPPSGTPFPALAAGFDLRSGAVNVTVPKDIVPGEDYFIVLFGDAKNASPVFTIIAKVAL